MSFATRLIISEGGEIRIITAKEDGRDAWFVVRLHSENYVEYKSVARGGDGNIRDYGAILESGWGTLSKPDMEALKLKYNQRKAAS